MELKCRLCGIEFGSAAALQRHKKASIRGSCSVPKGKKAKIKKHARQARLQARAGTIAQQFAEALAAGVDAAELHDMDVDCNEPSTSSPRSRQPLAAAVLAAAAAAAAAEHCDQALPDAPAAGAAAEFTSIDEIAALCVEDMKHAASDRLLRILSHRKFDLAAVTSTFRNKADLHAYVDSKATLVRCHCIVRRLLLTHCMH
jgi:hypothetical protein